MGFGFWVLGFGFWVLGFGFWVLGLGLLWSALGCGMWGFRACWSARILGFRVLRVFLECWVFGN